MAGFNITVRTLTDQNQQIKVNPDTKCRDLKEIIHHTLKIPTERQRLIYKGHVLKDDKRICDYGILEDHVVHIVERDPLPVEAESSTAQGNAPPAPPTAPTQGASAQYTVPGSGARVTVRTIPVGGDRMDQGAMEQLTQQIAQQVTAQFQQQHQQTIQDHHHHHHRGMPSRAQLMEGINVVSYYHVKRIRSSVTNVNDAVQEYESLVQATWQGDPPTPPGTAGSGPASGEGRPNQAGAHGQSTATPPSTDTAPPSTDTAPPSSDTAPPSSDAAPPRSDAAPPTSDAAMPSSDTAAVPAEVLGQLYADLQSVSQRLTPLVARQQQFIANGQQVTGPYLQHYLCLNRALSHSFRALGVAYSELQNITASMHAPPPHVVQLMPIRPQIPGQVIRVVPTHIPPASSEAPAESSPPQAPRSGDTERREEEEEEEEEEDEEEEEGEVDEDVMRVILQGMTAGGGPAVMMQSMLRTFLGARPPRVEGEGAAPPSRQAPSSGEGTEDGPTPEEEQGPPPEARQAFNPLALLAALGGVPDPSSPHAVGNLVSSIFGGMNPTATIADTLPSMARRGQPSQGLLMDLLPYLGRGITVGEFVQMNTGQSQPHLTNLRSNLLLFLRDRVLDGRDPSPSTRDEVVQYFADKITPSLIASWGEVRVREGIDFPASLRKCVWCEVDAFVGLVLDPPSESSPEGLGMQTLHQLEHIVSAIGSIARYCVDGDEAYFAEAVIERAIDDLYISQMQQGGGNPLLHLMGDFASQVFASSLQNNPLPPEEVEPYVVRVSREDAAPTPQTASSGEGAGKAGGGSTDEQSGKEGAVSSGGVIEPSVAAEDPSCVAPAVSGPAELQPTGSGGAASLPEREWPAGMPQVSHSDAYQAGNPSKKRKVTTDMLSPPETLRRTLLSAIEESEVTPTSGIHPENIASEATEDEVLTVAFTDELNQMTRERVARDPNYSGERFPASKEFYKL